MKKIITAMFVSAALCAPSVATAQDYNTDLDLDLLMTEFETEEECEEALAEARREQRATFEYEGRDRGQANKAFNARYQCVEDDDEDGFVIEDDDA